MGRHTPLESVVNSNWDWQHGRFDIQSSTEACSVLVSTVGITVQSALDSEHGFLWRSVNVAESVNIAGPMAVGEA